MRQLAAALAQIQLGESGTIIIDGPGGIGKSRLLAELAGLATSLGWYVISFSGCQPVDGTDESSENRSSESPFVDALENVGAFRRTEVTETLATTIKQHRDARTIDQSVLYDSCDALAADAPTLVLADDAQWLDPATLDLLGVLGTANTLAGILVVSAFRPHTSKSVRAYRRTSELASAPALLLSSLTDGDVRDLARRHLGRQATESESEFLAKANGNPRRLRECLDTLTSGLHRGHSTIPAPLTTLVGRTTELTELRALLETTRLITLTGTGGCGKTRLAQELGRSVERHFEGGAIWVELAPRSDEPGVIGALAAEVGSGEAEEGALDRIRASLARRSNALIVLDNAEHVLDAVAALVVRLFTEVPQLRIVCTSREPLDVAGEVVWRVPPLPSPDAVQLFVERASRVRRGFVLSGDNAEAVTEICARVDGIPLAIELAAARIRSMSPNRIASQLDNRLPGHRPSDRSAAARQQTLDASIAWSEGLLDDAERIVFRRLSVFVGGFTLDAAQAVVSQRISNERAVDPYEVADIITRLVDKSLVVFDDPRDRFFLLETIRTFARRRLDETGESPTIRDAHAEWFASWLRNLDDIANARDAQQFIDRTPVWLRVIAPELANCHSAFEWVPTGGSVSLRLTAGLGYYWLLVDGYEDAVRFGLAAILTGDSMSFEWGEAAMWLVGVIDNSTADGASILHNAAVTSGAPFSGRVQVRLDGALMNSRLGDVGPTDTELAKFAEHRRRATEVKDWYTLTNYTYVPASVCAEFGMLNIAEAMLGGFENHRTELTVALCQAKRGDLRAAAATVANAAALVQRDFPASFAELSEVAIVLAEIEVLSGTANELLDGMFVRLKDWGKGRTAITAETFRALWGIARGDLATAREVLETSGRCEYPIYAGTAKNWLAQVDMALGDNAAARTTAESLLADWSHLRAPLFEATAHLVLAECNITDSPSDALTSAHLALAAAAEYGLWVGVVDALEMIGTTLLSNGRDVVGARLLGAAHSARSRMGYRHRFAHRATYVGSAQAQARTTLGWAEGRALALDAAIQLAQRTRGERIRPKTGWSSLTPTELQVAELVVGGLTNPEVAMRLFMSRATVKTHLVHIFAKLSVRSRTEMARRYQPPG